MSYAIRKDGQGWRAVNGPDDVMDSEIFSKTQPMLVRTDAEILSGYTAAVQARLDDFARTRGYDGMLSACSYATSTNAKFAAESQYCVTARDNTWAACYAIMADVESGKRTMPTLGEIMAELPALSWPVTPH